MRRVNAVAIAAIVAVGVLGGFASPASAQTVTAFEGARLIVGDGRVIENATLVVDGAKIVRPARAADVRVPAGAARVSLAGKTVMPMLIDTHVHLSATRDAHRAGPEAARLLRRERRAEPRHGRLRGARHARPDDSGRRAVSAARGAGITMPEPGRTTVPYWVTSEAEGRKAVEELAAHKVDIVKIWVDTRDGKYKKLTPEIYGADHRRGAQARAAGHRAHLRARGREGADSRRDRRVRARRARPGHRRRAGGDVQAAAGPGPHAEPAGPRREGGPRAGCGPAFRPRSSPSSRRPTPTGRRRRPSTGSRRATWRS